VHLVPTRMSYGAWQLAEFVEQHHITIWYSVPSALVMMMNVGDLLTRPAPKSLRAVLFAGEPFPMPDLRRIASWTSARLLNLYGPTETNVCTRHEVVAADLHRTRPAPIGTAVCGDRVWAITGDGSVAAPAEQGELVVDGPTVMLGYWGDEPQRGPYRTGDLVEVLPDGSFDYVGRLDHLVKIRGHRVSPGEVEAVLLAHDDISAATVLVLGTGVAARLVAVLVAAGRRPGLLGIRRHCADWLPTYMIPDDIRFVADMPRNRNGKLDRADLAAMVGGNQPREETHG
jgi:acyl-coenzyme A synthetase/AMP-(fatty) acid ligase